MTHAPPHDPEGSEPHREAGFAAVLREGTKAAHREAERSGFIADLIRNRATRDGYATFLRNLEPAYAVMESALTLRRDDALFAPFADPRLFRHAALVRDLEAIAGPDWASTRALVPEAEAYARAIEAASHGDGVGLVAHAYARYLGDLSGGQILKPLLSRTLGLGPDALGFYDFPGFADLDAPKLAMRQALDGVVPDGPRAEAIVEEANAAFRHNIDVSVAVQAVPV